MKLNVRNKNWKNQTVLNVGIWFYILLLLMRIPLSRVIGDAGMGLFAPAFELFWVISLFTSYSMSKSMSGVIRYRVKREQYKNAGKVLNAAFFINITVSVLLAAALVLLARLLAELLFLEPLSRMAILAAAPVIVFAALIGMFRGFFQGYGLGVLAAHSQYLEGIAMIVCTLACGNLFNAYGEKVAVLLKADAYTYAYGALGAMVGVLLSQLITILYLLVIYIVYSGTLKRKLGQDSGKRPETQVSLRKLLLGSSIPMALAAFCFNGFMLIDQRMFNYCMNKKEMGETRTALWGCYYSKPAVLVGIAAALVCLGVSSYVGRISSAYEKEDYRVMRERLGKAIRKVCLLSFPAAIGLAVLAEAAVKCLYKGLTDEPVAWAQKGAVLIVLCSFSFLFGQLFYKIHMVRELLAVSAFSLLVHVAAAYLLVQKALLGADGVIYSLILFWAVHTVLSFGLLCRHLKYRQAWITDVAFPAAAACVSGLAVLLLNRLLYEPAGAAVTLIVSCLAGGFLYVTLLMVLRVIGEAELAKMPFGFFFLMLGQNIGVL